jgi:hypothetical protein
MKNLPREMIKEAMAIVTGLGLILSAAAVNSIPVQLTISDVFYIIPDTGQTLFYNNTDIISSTEDGEPFYGQDAQYSDSPQPDYQDNGDGTVTDLNTGLMWQKDPGSFKKTYDEALEDVESLDLAGYTDWRMPSIKELYSLIDFNGRDPSGYEGSDTSGLIPFINTNYFNFQYGDPDNGERIIDAQYASSNLYVSSTMNDGGRTAFGVNFADGRIKGYGLTIFGQDKTFFVIYVRGPEKYGANTYEDNNDGTITDLSTGLMWQKDDSGYGMTWEDALDYAEELELAYYQDWRLPNAKELQNILDYTRSPDTTGSPAIDPVFTTTTITNEAGDHDYPCFWTGTTHANWTDRPGSAAVYIAFGRAMGYMGGTWGDVHGAGAQRSDPKEGDPDDYPFGRGPQGDAIRIYNYVRCVRTAPIPEPGFLSNIVVLLLLLKNR